MVNYMGGYFDTVPLFLPPLSFSLVVVVVSFSSFTFSAFRRIKHTQQYHIDILNNKFEAYDLFVPADAYAMHAAGKYSFSFFCSFIFFRTAKISRLHLHAVPRLQLS